MYVHLGQIMARETLLNNKLEVGNEVNVVSMRLTFVNKVNVNISQQG